MSDEELLAALREALDLAKADEIEAAARKGRYAAAITALGDVWVERGQCHDCGATGELSGGLCRDGCPIVAAPKTKPPAAPKPPAKHAVAKRPPKPCCGSLGPRHKAGCGGESEPAALTVVPDPVPSGTPESRHPSTAPEPSGGRYECSSCTETFADVAKLVSHTLDTHNRVPRSAERVLIPA